MGGWFVFVTALPANVARWSPRLRDTDASLVKELESRGIGRPSTWASIIQTIQDRGYVWKKGSALVPTFTAFAVVTLLEQHFPKLVDYAFTARMEDDLDGIAGADGWGDERPESGEAVRLQGSILIHNRQSVKCCRVVQAGIDLIFTRR